MKKSLIALAVFSACAGTAYADDSTLTLYGILDVGILTVDHSENFNGGGFVTGAAPYATGSNLGNVSRATGIMNGGESATRWGIRGSEDMGNGMKAFFQLESGVSLTNGSLATSALAQANIREGVSGANDTSLNGQLFGRAAFLGISSPEWGAISGGRVTSLQLDIIGRYDPVNAQVFSPINFSGTYGGGGVTDNSRVDNAIKYVGKWDAFNLGLVHKFGGIAGCNTCEQVNEANIGWESGPFGIQAAYTMANDTTKLDNNGTVAGGIVTPYPAGTVGVTWVDIRSYMLAAKWDVTTQFTLKAGYERYEVENPSNPAVDATQTSIFGYGIAHTSLSPLVAGGPNQIDNVYWVGGNYDFTPAWRLSLGWYHVHQNDFSNGSAAVSNLGKIAGDQNNYSAMLEYKFSKRTNAYGAIMLTKWNGGLANAVNGSAVSGVTGFGSSGVDSYTAIGVGIRHIF
jgi:predicted porin